MIKLAVVVYFYINSKQTTEYVFIFNQYPVGILFLYVHACLYFELDTETCIVLLKAQRI